MFSLYFVRNSHINKIAELSPTFLKSICYLWKNNKECSFVTFILKIETYTKTSLSPFHSDYSSQCTHNKYGITISAVYTFTSHQSNMQSITRHTLDFCDCSGESYKPCPQPGRALESQEVAMASYWCFYAFRRGRHREILESCHLNTSTSWQVHNSFIIISVITRRDRRVLLTPVILKHNTPRLNFSCGINMIAPKLHTP